MHLQKAGEWELNKAPRAWVGRMRQAVGGKHKFWVPKAEIPVAIT